MVDILTCFCNNNPGQITWGRMVNVWFGCWSSSESEADLLKRLEEVGCEPGEEGQQAVFKVSLIRDFKGKLHSMRKVLERAKKIGEQSETTPKEEKELADAEEELNHLNLEEKDVLGAFVTFTYIKFKDFVSVLAQQMSLGL